MRPTRTAVAFTATALLYGSSGINANVQLTVNETCTVDADGEGNCNVGQAAAAAPGIDITCNHLDSYQIDWDCVFGPESLEEVFQRGGIFTTCPTASKAEPCSRFIVAKEEERSEVKVQRGPEGFPFLKHQRYVFKYSFRAVEGMRVANRFTHLGQLKGSAGGYMIKGDPIYSLTANNKGLMVRFSNLESIEDYHPGMEEFMSWEDATGDWVNVEIVTVFGESMEVFISGAVTGHAIWPQNLQPVAWHRDSEMVRMKLGLYHSPGNVHDGEVEYKNISIEGPNGIIRTSPESTGAAGAHMIGCFKDVSSDRILENKWEHPDMTAEMCSNYCEGNVYFGTQYSNECWCGNEDSVIGKHGTTQCTMMCAGAADETCGGKLAMNVYKRGGVPADYPGSIKYLDCFKDYGYDRALTYGTRRVRSNGMTYDDCLEYCGSKGSGTHMGLQFGKECYCGNADDNHAKHGDAVCHMPCSGNSNSICGGGNAMSVFRIE